MLEERHRGLLRELHMVQNFADPNLLAELATREPGNAAASLLLHSVA